MSKFNVRAEYASAEWLAKTQHHRPSRARWSSLSATTRSFAETAARWSAGKRPQFSCHVIAYRMQFSMQAHHTRARARAMRMRRNACTAAAAATRHIGNAPRDALMLPMTREEPPPRARLLEYLLCYHSAARRHR